MKKIVVLSGSHGVGKTTLIKKISATIAKDDLLTENVKIFHEVNTGLYNVGLALNGEGCDFDEIIFSQKMAFNLGFDIINYYISRQFDSRLVLMDRSCVDTFIYTKYFASFYTKQKSKYADTLEIMKEKCLSIVPHILHVLIPPFHDKEGSCLKNKMGYSEQLLIWESFLDYFRATIGYNAIKITQDSINARHEELYHIILSYVKGSIPKEEQKVLYNK